MDQLAPDGDLGIDREGRWRWNGVTLIHPDIIRLFADHLHRNERGYFVRLENQEYPVTVEEQPFYAMSLALDGDWPQVNLRDGRVVGLSRDGLLFKGEVPFISFRWPWDTKLSRAAFWQVSSYLCEQGDGAYSLMCGGATIPVYMQ